MKATLQQKLHDLNVSLGAHHWRRHEWYTCCHFSLYSPMYIARVRKGTLNFGQWGNARLWCELRWCWQTPVVVNSIIWPKRLYWHHPQGGPCWLIFCDFAAFKGRLTIGFGVSGYIEVLPVPLLAETWGNGETLPDMHSNVFTLQIWACLLCTASNARN